MTTDLFFMAIQGKYRYNTPKGTCNTEQLSDLGLNDLDVTAQELNRELKASAEESFVKRPTTASTDLANRLAVVVAIIEYKLQQAEARTNAAKVAEQRRRLLDAIAEKEDQATKDMSLADLKAQLAQLGSD
jgi:hypothetical protein